LTDAPRIGDAMIGGRPGILAGDPLAPVLAATKKIYLRCSYGIEKRPRQLSPRRSLHGCAVPSCALEARELIIESAILSSRSAGHSRWSSAVLPVALLRVNVLR